MQVANWFGNAVLQLVGIILYLLHSVSVYIVCMFARLILCSQEMLTWTVHGAVKVLLWFQLGLNHVQRFVTSGGLTVTEDSAEAGHVGCCAH